MRLIQFLTIAALLSCLPACLTAYRAPTATMSSCEDYDRYLVRKYFKTGTEQRRSGLLDVGSETMGALELFDLDARNREWIPHLTDSHEDHASPNSHPIIEPIIVRYSEGGDLVSRCDYSRVLHALNATAESKRVVFVYIHGWNNDSGPNHNKAYNYGSFPTQAETSGGDLHKFGRFLAKRHQHELSVTKDGEKPAVVIGIYVSWKGKSIIPYLDYWSRRSGADKLARSAQLSRLFGAIENIVEQERLVCTEVLQEDAKEGMECSGEMKTFGRKQTKLVYMGHSMGTRVLYNAMAPRISYNVQRAYPPNDDLDPVTGKPALFGEVTGGPDLILMISPALDAAAYKAMDEFRYSRPHFDTSQRPQMLTIQSEGDATTKIPFLLAEGIGIFNDPYQSKLRRRSIGHYNDFVTHKLISTSCTCKGSTEGREAEGREKVNLIDPFCNGTVKLIYCPQPALSTDKKTLARTNHATLKASLSDDPAAYSFDALCGTSKYVENQPIRPLHPSPFLVVQVEQKILSSHGFFLDEQDGKDGDGNGFVPWLHAYIDAFGRDFDKQAESPSCTISQ